MEEKPKKDSVSPLSKLALGVVLVLGVVLILADTQIHIPDRSRTEQQENTPVQTIAIQPETAPAEPETQPFETEPQPAESETLPPPKQTLPPVVISGSDGPVEHEIRRWDRSYVNAEGKQQMTYYFDYPVLHSEEEAHKRINEAVYRKAEAFMTEMTQEQIETPMMSIFNTPTECIYTMESRVCHNGEGVLSLEYTSNYYMGGNHSIKNRRAVTYSLRTGEELNLIQLTNMEEAALLEELQTRAYIGLEEAAGPMLIADAKGVLERYTLDDFEFLIESGEIVLLFDTYQFTAGAAGPQYLKTGLYIPFA